VAFLSENVCVRCRNDARSGGRRVYRGGAGATGLAVAFALTAKGHYVRLALRRILGADELDLGGDERKAYLARSGGVSIAGGTVAGLVFAGALGLIAFNMIQAIGEWPQ
jgi:hypothetical protein